MCLYLLPEMWDVSKMDGRVEVEGGGSIYQRAGEGIEALVKCSIQCFFAFLFVQYSLKHDVICDSAWLKTQQ